MSMFLPNSRTVSDAGLRSTVTGKAQKGGFITPFKDLIVDAGIDNCFTNLWTTFREGAFNGGVQLLLGYFFMLEDCQASKRPVKVKEPDFARKLEKTSL
jgi:hypothetical protein